LIGWKGMVIHCFFVIWQVSNNIILENGCFVYMQEVHNMVSKSGAPQKFRTYRIWRFSPKTGSKLANFLKPGLAGSAGFQ
jgi:hypothetical protein